MDCSFCGSQSTTFVKGTSKKTGKPWSAYDCDEPACKNDMGRPNRTFVPFGPKSPATGFKKPFNGPLKTPQSTSGTLEAKVDQILSILKAKFGHELNASEMTGNNEEDQTPF